MKPKTIGWLAMYLHRFARFACQPTSDTIGAIKTARETRGDSDQTAAVAGY